MFSMPPVTQALVVINVLVFLLQQVMPHQLDAFALAPLVGGVDPIEGGFRFQPWQLVTYAFLHGGWAHLFFNMLALVMFGSEIERVWGSRRYATYYLVCVISAAA